LERLIVQTRTLLINKEFKLNTLVLDCVYPYYSET